jgi:nucleoside-diphosphate-sugar epimerase
MKHQILVTGAAGRLGAVGRTVVEILRQRDLTITYVDVPLEHWRDEELRRRDLPHHVLEHLLTMARLHADNRYDRLKDDVRTITGRPTTSTRNFVARHADLCASSPNNV